LVCPDSVGAFIAAVFCALFFVFESCKFSGHKNVTVNMRLLRAVWMICRGAKTVDQHVFGSCKFGVSGVTEISDFFLQTGDYFSVIFGGDCWNLNWGKAVPERQRDK
jgi:hypothetical protein